MELIWYCGLRSGSLRSVDLRDTTDIDSDPMLDLKHRPLSGTPLKNGIDGERPVNLSQRVAEAFHEYIEGNRIDLRDEYGRGPLLTTANGQLSEDTLKDTVYLQPHSYHAFCLIQKLSQSYSSKSGSSNSPLIPLPIL